VWAGLILLLLAGPAFAAEAAAPAPAAQAVPAAPASPAPGSPTYAIIPLHGIIGKTCSAPQIKASLEQATKLGPTVVVLDIDTDGRDIHEAEAIIDAMIEAKDVRFATLVRRALGAGAAIAMACEDIYMTESATIGASVASAGDAADSNLSAWSAVFRKAAQHGRHPGILAQAMVDPSFALTMRSQGETVIIERDGAGDVLKPRGRVLTLTAREAVSCGLARGMADAAAAIGPRIGLPGWQELAMAQVPAAPAAGPAPAAPKSAGSPRAYVIPISGDMKTSVLAEAVETALAEAARQRATVIIFRMNTGGGYIFVADKVIKLIESIDWATTVAFVSGDERQALSAGAYICLSTQRIYMAPGCTIGAATPYHLQGIATPSGTPTTPRTSTPSPQRPFSDPTSSGPSMTVSAEVDEKMLSIFRARFRNLARARGYPLAIAEAMVDSRCSVIEVCIDGKWYLMTDEEARRVESSARVGGSFRRGRTINEAGRLITLTSDEALRFRICTAIVNNERELLQAMGLANCPIVEASWLPQWVEKTAAERKKKIDDLIDYFRSQGEQVNATAPTLAYRSSSTIYAGTTEVKRLRDKCQAGVRECVKAVSELEKLSKDPRYNDYIRPATVDAMKRSIERTNALVNAL
jgi:membrane-bound ClpP family serine protease